MMIEGSSKRPCQDEDQQINFSALDVDIVEDNSNDLIVVFSIINNYLVERILVDNGSAIEVLMWDAFKKMGLDKSLLKPATPIYEFANQPIKAKGLITLSVKLGQRDNTLTEIAEFLVVDQPSTYNAIIS